MSEHNKGKNGTNRMGAMKDTANEMADTGAGVMEGAREAVGNAAGAVGDFARSAARTVTDTATNAADRVSHMATDAVGAARAYAGGAATMARDRAGEAFDVTRDAAENAHEQMTKWVRQNPMTALAVGVGIGFVLGRGMFRSN